jgi:hypothetical protein
MFSLAHFYNSASSYAAKPVRTQPIFLSIIFHHYKQLRNLSKEMNQERLKRPAASNTAEMAESLRKQQADQEKIEPITPNPPHIL